MKAEPCCSHLLSCAMCENGNKIGLMGGGTFVDGDGDINSIQWRTKVENDEITIEEYLAEIKK